jgi:hypothetical protein
MSRPASRETGGVVCRPRTRFVILTPHKPWRERPRPTRAYLALARNRRVAHAMVCLSVTDCPFVGDRAPNVPPAGHDCVNVRAAIYGSDQNIDMHVDLVCPEVALLLHNHVGPRAGLTGRPVAPAITRSSLALCSASSMLFASHSSSFDRAFRAAFGHGQRLRAARELGNYVMAGIHATLRYDFRVVMSIKVTYKDGVFEPLEDVKARVRGSGTRSSLTRSSTRSARRLAG